MAVFLPAGQLDQSLGARDQVEAKEAAHLEPLAHLELELGRRREELGAGGNRAFGIGRVRAPQAGPIRRRANRRDA